IIHNGRQHQELHICERALQPALGIEAGAGQSMVQDTGSGHASSPASWNAKMDKASFTAEHPITSLPLRRSDPASPPEKTVSRLPPAVCRAGLAASGRAIRPTPR